MTGATLTTDTETKFLADRKAAGKAAFDAAPMPTRKDEQWRFTRLRGVDLDNLPTMSPCGDEAAVRERIATAHTRVEDVAASAIHVNGATLELQNNDLPEGVVFTTLQDAAVSHPELLERYFGAIVSTGTTPDDKFVNLNTANLDGGVLFYVPRNTRVELPVRADVVMTADSMVNWRALVILDEGAEATFVEEFLSLDGSAGGFSNSVVELVAGQNSHLHYVTAQDYSVPTQIFATHRVHAERDAQVSWSALGMGGSIGKTRMEAHLNGAGSNVKLTGAYFVDGTQQIDYDTYQLHAAPNAVSDLAFKGVLRDKSHAIWRGMIAVAPGAQGTDAFQENRNLVLTSGAHADSVPGLQIEANDVRCTHASTTSKVDPEQLFYFQARGISRDEAVLQMVRGFFTDVLERIEVEQIREQIQAALWARIGR
jgi:Fe-S cluster assembly protein SufD